MFFSKAILRFPMPLASLSEHKIGIFVRFCPPKPPFSAFPSTKSRFLCQKGQFFPGFTPFRAQNRVFCVKMGDFSEILGCFDTKSAFLCSWMAAASPAVPAEAQQGPPELSTARHEPCGVHLAAVRPAIDCRNPLPRAPTTTGDTRRLAGAKRNSVDVYNLWNVCV